MTTSTPIVKEKLLDIANGNKTLLSKASSNNYDEKKRETVIKSNL